MIPSHDLATNRLNSKFQAMLTLLDDVRSPHHKDSPGFQNPLMRAAVVFAVAVIETTVNDIWKKESGKAKRLAERVEALATTYEIPVRPDQLVWVRGMVELRNSIVHTDPPTKEAERFIQDAALPVDPDELGGRHVDPIRNQYDMLSLPLMRIFFRQGVPRDQWRRPELPPPGRGRGRASRFRR